MDSTEKLIETIKNKKCITNDCKYEIFKLNILTYRKEEQLHPSGHFNYDTLNQNILEQAILEQAILLKMTSEIRALNMGIIPKMDVVKKIHLIEPEWNEVRQNQSCSRMFRK